MEPNIKRGDIAIIKEVSEDKLKNNDIISFVVDGNTITHRIVDIEEIDGKLFYTTKGDANNINDDEKITYENIVGKYIGKIPVVGKISLKLRGI